MGIRFIRAGSARRCAYLAYSLLLCSSFMAAHVSAAADKLEITDEYLQGLSEEISSPEYVTKAKDELAKTEKQEKSQAAPSKQVTQALVDIDSFEALLKSKYPASYKIYGELSQNSRVSVFRQFNKTKKLSAAKRMIIEHYLNL